MAEKLEDFHSCEIMIFLEMVIYFFLFQAIGIFFKLLKSKDPNLNRAELAQKLQRRLVIFENELGKRKTTYFFSDDQPGLLDFNIWPWFERLDVFPIAYPEIGNAVLPNENFPLLVSFYSVKIHD